MSAPTCPRCGRPIPDTAYVCPSCQDELAADLRRAAELWPALEGTVARQSRVSPSTSVGGRVTRPAGHGPACPWCLHPSCVAIRRAQVIARQEPPHSREDKGVLDLTASENAWIATNTTDAWTRQVSESRGTSPRSYQLPRKPEPLHVIRDDERPELCIFSDLPYATCRCGHPHPNQEAS